MKKLRRKFIFLLTLFILFVGFGLWLLLIHFFPSLAFYDYPIIPAFFYIFGLISIYTLTGLKIDRANKLFNVFMFMRGVKIVLAIILSAAYWLFDRAEIKSFVIMLAAFYLCYLFLEIYIYVELEAWFKGGENSLNKSE